MTVEDPELYFYYIDKNPDGTKTSNTKIGITNNEGIKLEGSFIMEYPINPSKRKIEKRETFRIEEFSSANPTLAISLLKAAAIIATEGKVSTIKDTVFNADELQAYADAFEIERLILSDRGRLLTMPSKGAISAYIEQGSPKKDEPLDVLVNLEGINVQGWKKPIYIRLPSGGTSSPNANMN